MSTFKCRPYYAYNGPSFSEPFRQQLSEEVATRNMGCFFDEVANYFEDVGARVEPRGDGVIAIATDVSQADCDNRVKRCLNSLDLYAQKIERECVR